MGRSGFRKRVLLSPRFYPWIDGLPALCCWHMGRISHSVRNVLSPQKIQGKRVVEITEDIGHCYFDLTLVGPDG